jgi:Mg-chelatase subunit ChlD
MKNILGIVRNWAENRFNPSLTLDQKWAKNQSECLRIPGCGDSPSLRLCHHTGETVSVIDVSPSMSEDDYPPSRLEAAKNGIRAHFQRLAETEPSRLVGIVQFCENAHVVSKPMPVGAGLKRLFKGIESLTTGLGTNLGDGLKCAESQIQGVSESDDRAIIVLTDGHSNGGPPPVEIGHNIKAKGIRIDVIGIGGSPAAVNEAELTRVASPGRYWFIRNVPDLLRRFEALALAKVK